MDDVIDRANLGERRAGLEHEAVANMLFRELFVSDVKSALDPEANPTEAFLRVHGRVGASLGMHMSDFLAAIRIGALNQERRDGAWLDLNWSKKRLLAGVFELKHGATRFAEGIELAGRPNVGVRHLRQWVYSLEAKKPGTAGRPRGTTFSLRAGGKFAETGVQLKNARHRQRFVRELDGAPAEKRAEIVKDLEDALEGLQALVDEIRKPRR